MTTQEHLELIAREAAASAVGIEESGADDWSVSVAGKVLPQYHPYRRLAAPHAEEMERLLAPFFLAACERALLGVPLPGGMSDARLAEIALQRSWPCSWPAEGAARVIDDLLAEVALCRRVIGDADVSAAVLRLAREDGRRQGFAEGAEVQHAESERAADAAARNVPLNQGSFRAARMVADAVCVAPLAEMPKEDDA